MRQSETNGEAINALAQRVLDRSYKADVDFNKVFYAVDQYSKRIGVDSKDLDQLEKVKLALAYNIPTGDDNFDKIKVDSRKGLAKLINDNNAMAFEDYLQALPFMDYTRGVISKAANNMFSRAPKMYIQDQILDKAAKSAATGVIDNAIDRVAMSKFSNIGNRLKFIHGSKYLAKKFKKHSFQLHQRLLKKVSSSYLHLDSQEENMIITQQMSLLFICQVYLITQP